jgi:hypothetical protein|tara:strand:+ start:474 stop:818 length:345 start_codon:yes stop_codon:yes gene_type:complete
MATSKMSRPAAEEVSAGDTTSSFDFGEPEVVPVEISEGKFLYLKEPCAEDLIHIADINDDEKLGEIEATLQTICILHAPERGGKKLSMRDAKRLTARQLKKIGEALGTLLGSDE